MENLVNLNTLKNNIEAKLVEYVLGGDGELEEFADIVILQLKNKKTPAQICKLHITRSILGSSAEHFCNWLSKHISTNNISLSHRNGEDSERGNAAQPRNNTKPKPINAKAQDSEAAGVSTVSKKKQNYKNPRSQRCNFWPECYKGDDECNFHHPKLKCKNFPNCPDGQSCMYRHPICYYHNTCINEACNYIHGKTFKGRHFEVNRQIQCRFHKYGAKFCFDITCTRNHLNVSIARQLSKEGIQVGDDVIDLFIDSVEQMKPIDQMTRDFHPFLKSKTAEFSQWLWESFCRPESNFIRPRVTKETPHAGGTSGLLPHPNSSYPYFPDFYEPFSPPHYKSNTSLADQRQYQPRPHHQPRYPSHQRHHYQPSFHHQQNQMQHQYSQQQRYRAPHPQHQQHQGQLPQPIYHESMKNLGANVIDIKEQPNLIKAPVVEEDAKGTAKSAARKQGTSRLFATKSSIGKPSSKIDSDNDQFVDVPDLSTMNLAIWQQDLVSELQSDATIVDGLRSKRISIEDVCNVVKNLPFKNAKTAKERLVIECHCCFGTFSKYKIETFPCEKNCEICADCFIRHSTIVIKEKSPSDLKCPACSGPDDIYSGCYLEVLNSMIKRLLPEEIFELMDRRLRDANIRSDPNFKWCPNTACRQGFVLEAGNSLRKIHCPHCQSEFCSDCNKEWKAVHAEMTCEEYDEYLLKDDPQMKIIGLAAYLKKEFIKCRNCKMSYNMARGGCQHFTCTECKFMFCGDCGEEFFPKNKKCKKNWASCRTKGFHAHHPRNCFTSLRDWPVSRLVKLLMKNEKKAYFDLRTDSTRCKVFIQPDHTAGDAEIPCNKPHHSIGFGGIHWSCGGLCQSHYKEFLVGQIRKHSIDPVDDMDVEEMSILLEHSLNVTPPVRGYASSEGYSRVLRQKIKTEHPLY